MGQLQDYATLPLPLTPVEQETLQDYEATIERGLTTFYEVGAALIAIKTQKLYRAKYRTFEEYCIEKWHIGHSRAYQLIEAASIRENLSTTVDILPENERQMRELKGLEPDQQRQVWAKAVDTAPGGKVTAQHIKDVRQVEIPIPEPEPKMMITTNHPISVFVPDEQPRPHRVFLPADDERLPDCPLCDPPVALKYKTYGKHGIFCPTCHREWPSVEVMKKLWETPEQDDSDDPAEREPEAVIKDDLELEPAEPDSGVYGTCHFCGSALPEQKLYTATAVNGYVLGHICGECAQRAARSLDQHLFQFMHQDRARMCAAGLVVFRVDLYKRIILMYDPEKGGTWKSRLKCKNDGELEEAIMRVSEEPNTIFENRI